MSREGIAMGSARPWGLTRDPRPEPGVIRASPARSPPPRHTEPLQRQQGHGPCLIGDQRASSRGAAGRRALAQREGAFRSQGIFFFFKYAIIFKRRDHLSPCIVLESGHTCLVLTYCIAVSMQNTLICGQDFFGGRRGRRLISKIAAVFLSFDLQKVLQRVENG